MAIRTFHPVRQKRRRSACRIPALLRGHRNSKGKDLIVRRPNYKPIPLRWPFLASLLLILCLLIALTEYARHILPLTKYNKGPDYSSPIPGQSAGSRQSLKFNARKVADGANTTAPNIDGTPTPAPWAFKNTTTLSPGNNTSVSENGTALATNSSFIGNQTILPPPRNLYPNPVDYAGYSSAWGPIRNVKVRCKGEGDENGRLLWEMGVLLYDAAGNPNCSAIYTFWESDDPNDCQAQFFWYWATPVPPWTWESPYGPGDGGWNFYYGDQVWPPLENCPPANVVGGSSFCHKTWDCDSNEDIVVTTTFQIQKEATTTSNFAVSEIYVADVYTETGGQLTTHLETSVISGGGSTITTSLAVQVTAVGYPGGLTWELVESASPALTSSFDGTYQAKTLNRYSSTTTFSSTEYLTGPPSLVQTTTQVSSDATSTGLGGILSETIMTLFDSDAFPMDTLTMELDILTDVYGRPTTTIVELLETLRGSDGVPTSTLTMELDILTDSSGLPTAKALEYLETLKDSNGSPTKTITVTSNILVESPTTTPMDSYETVLDTNGIPTQTLTISFDTLTDSLGRATKTLEEFMATTTITGQVSIPTYGNLSNVTTGVLLSVPIEPATYFMATFLPVVLTASLSILIQLVDKNLKSMLPFYALARPTGVPAADSLCMIPGGLMGPLYSMRLSCRFRESISLLGDILILLTSVLVSISSEAIGISISGRCDLSDFRGCNMFFEAFNGPSRAVEALLTIMAFVVALICMLFYPMRSGVSFNPWSIAATASLLSEKTTELFQSFRLQNSENIEMKQINRHLEGRNFALGSYFGSRGIIEYGIVPRPEDQSAIESLPTSHLKAGRKRWSCRWLTTKFITKYGVRVLFLMTLCGLLILILYYDTTRLDAVSNSFEGFIDSQKFGVRSFFVGFGVIISFFWDDMFSRVVRMQPYKDLAQSSQRSNASISASLRPTVFPGLWSALRNRQGFTSIVAFTTVLSKITPIFLSNIPFRITQTWSTHKFCAWTTVSILAFMILVLIWSFFVKEPQMPVDASTIAGNMYYLYDSSILKDFQGTSRLSEREWKAHLKGIKNKYKFKEMARRSGQRKIGIYRDGALDG